VRWIEVALGLRPAPSPWSRLGQSLAVRGAEVVLAARHHNGGPAVGPEMCDQLALGKGFGCAGPLNSPLRIPHTDEGVVASLGRSHLVRGAGRGGVHLGRERTSILVAGASRWDATAALSVTAVRAAAPIALVATSPARLAIFLTFIIFCRSR
jgi:hypothetical protein